MVKRKPSKSVKSNPLSSYDPPAFKVKRTTLQNLSPKQGSNTPYGDK